jgi:hypothetical protein
VTVEMLELVDGVFGTSKQDGLLGTKKPNPLQK